LKDRTKEEITDVDEDTKLSEISLQELEVDSDILFNLDSEISDKALEDIITESKEDQKNITLTTGD